MKRAKHIVDNITLALLRQEAIAAYNARRNKSRSVITEFRALMAPGGLKTLLGELQACTWRPAKPYALTIHEQGRKERHLEIPAFRDIVAQRALAAAGLERVLLRHTHARSYSSIKGRGPLKCAKHLRRLLSRGRSARWCLYFDVRKYYEHIDKGVLFADLKRVIKDRRALALLRQVLTIGARGLPIGNTLSHLFANFYLTPILRAIERLPGVSGLARAGNEGRLAGVSHGHPPDFCVRLFHCAGPAYAREQADSPAYQARSAHLLAHALTARRTQRTLALRLAAQCRSAQPPLKVFPPGGTARPQGRRITHRITK